MARPAVTATLVVVIVVQTVLLLISYGGDRRPPAAAPCARDGDGMPQKPPQHAAAPNPSSVVLGKPTQHTAEAGDVITVTTFAAAPPATGGFAAGTPSPVPTTPQTARPVETTGAGALGGFPLDCSEHLKTITAVNLSAAQRTCHNRMWQIEADEEKYVDAHPKMRWKRNQLAVPGDYMTTLDCIGMVAGPSVEEQRKVEHWAVRYPRMPAGHYVLLNTTGRSRATAYQVTTTNSHAADGKKNAVLVSADHPLLYPLHGGVGASKIVRQAHFLARLMGVYDDVVALSATSPVFGGAELPSGGKELVLAEMGAGHGALLYPLCPPHPRVRCYGSDFAAELVERGSAALRDDRIALRQGCLLPQVRAGTAAGVVSHAVMTYLHMGEACRHVAEALRVLRPGGVGVFWMLNRKWQGSRYSPTFFLRTATHGTVTQASAADSPLSWTRDGGGAGAPADVLPMCSHDLQRYVGKLSVFVEGPTGVEIYPASKSGYFGVRIQRNDVAWATTGSEAEEPEPAKFAPEAEAAAAEMTAAERALRIAHHRDFVSAGERMTLPGGVARRRKSGPRRSG